MWCLGFISFDEEILDDDNLLAQRIEEHNAMTPVLSAGDVDAQWGSRRRGRGSGWRLDAHARSGPGGDAHM